MILDPLKRVWLEDDVIGHMHPDYEDVWFAYHRLASSTLSYSDAVKTFDCGDETLYLMPDGYVVVCSGAGASRVYEP